jgi:hypothetical protein
MGASQNKVEKSVADKVEKAKAQLVTNTEDNHQSD